MKPALAEGDVADPLGVASSRQAVPRPPGAVVAAARALARSSASLFLLCLIIPPPHLSPASSNRLRFFVMYMLFTRGLVTSVCIFYFFLRTVGPTRPSWHGLARPHASPPLLALMDSFDLECLRLTSLGRISPLKSNPFVLQIMTATEPITGQFDWKFAFIWGFHTCASTSIYAWFQTFKVAPSRCLNLHLHFRFLLPQGASSCVL